MSVLVDAVTAVEKPVASSGFSLAPFSEAARREAAHHSCEDSWDDGCDSDEKLNVTSPATSGIDVETPGSEIHRKRNVLANDFANGHISGTSQALRVARGIIVIVSRRRRWWSGAPAFRQQCRKHEYSCRAR